MKKAKQLLYFSKFLLFSLVPAISSEIFDPEYDIAIIGAGAAGVSHAYYLKKENPELQIVIFEKDSHIGGKCYSYIDDQGKAHDMGALLESVNYRAIKELVDAAGIKRMDKNSNSVTCLNESQSAIKNFGWWKTLTAVRTYMNLVDKHKVKENWDFRNFSDDSVRMMPLDKLIKEYQLEPIEKLFEVGFRLFSYGRLDQILSGTAFSYIDSELLISYIAHHSSPIIKFFLGKIYSLPLWTLEGGFQRIFQNLASQMQEEPFPLNVFLNTKINKINSDHKGVIIESENTSWRAKAAYVTSGWQHIEMPGIDDQIRQLFKGLIHEDYGTTVFEAKKPVPLMLEYQEDGLDPTMCISKFRSEYSGTKVIAYTNGNMDQTSEIFNNLKIYLKRKGITLAKPEPLAQRQVEYHPRFSPQIIQEGVYKILEDNQGTGGIFFGGTPLTFDLSEAVAAHSKRMAPIVNNFLKR